MTLFRTASALLGLTLSSAAALAAEPETAPATPVEIFRNAEQIQTPDGIQEQRFVRIGGIDQWISIRGRHRANPILLYLHGGPGFTSIPTEYFYRQGWEEYFTVVQWDQRGAGKTYGANDPAKLRPTMTVERMTDDAEELAATLRKTYGRQRIVLLGESWGTVLGVKLAQRHPDWFYAYVAIGQFVDFARSEALGYQATLAAARADHNQAAVTELEATAPFPDPQHPERNLQNLSRERRWLEWYDGDSRKNHDGSIGSLSPDYSPQDQQAHSAGLDFGLQTLWGELSSVDLSVITQFGCPLVFLHGRDDLSTSATVLAQWYQTLQAPSKKLIWFEDSAHVLDQEEPGKVLVTLVQEVLPLTRSGDRSGAVSK